RAFRRTAPGDVPPAAWPQQGGLRGNDQPVLHRRQRDQGGTLAAARAAGGQRLDRDGGVPLCYPQRRLARLAAARKAGPAADLPSVPWLAGRDGVEAVVGWSVWLSRIGCKSRRIMSKRVGARKTPTNTTLRLLCMGLFSQFLIGQADAGLRPRR